MFGGHLNFVMRQLKHILLAKMKLIVKEEPIFSRKSNIMENLILMIIFSINCKRRLLGKTLHPSLTPLYTIMRPRLFKKCLGFLMVMALSCQPWPQEILHQDFSRALGHVYIIWPWVSRILAISLSRDLAIGFRFPIPATRGAVKIYPCTFIHGSYQVTLIDKLRVSNLDFGVTSN